MITEQTREEMRSIMGRYPQPRSALLPMLHLVQSSEGLVSPEGIEVCAAELDITAAEVAAVATFYTMYKRHPVGDYHVGVCTNTLCAVMGGDAILERLEEHLGVGNDETTEDGMITLEHIECNAACDYAPVMTVNWEFMDNQTPESAVQLVDDLRAGVERSATRGARLCTWRQAERVLAGFPDGRANEGPTAGPASLAGLELAKQHGWTSGSAPSEEADTSGPADGAGTIASGIPANPGRSEQETTQAEVGASAGSGHPGVRSDAPADDTAQHQEDTGKARNEGSEEST